MYDIGIDVGGTNLKAGLVDENYRIVATKKMPLEFDEEGYLVMPGGMYYGKV